MEENSPVYTAELQPEEIEARFETLQRKLKAMWRDIGRSDPGGPLQAENTIVVLPSLSVDVELTVADQQAYEERFLFMLFLLRQPNIRVIYLTSYPVPADIIDYYLDLIPGAVISNARARLFLVSPQDMSLRPLAQKILERPQLMGRIRALIPDPDRAHIVPFTTTRLERELAVRLGLPMYAADPRYFAFGTKSGCRRVFAEEGVSHPLGYEDLHSFDALLEAVAAIRARKPETARVIVKLNEGVGGMGNALVDLAELPPPGDPDERAALEGRLRAMRFELSSVEYEKYMGRLGEGGAIVEEMITGAEVRSPSAQLRVSPLGEVEMLSTHDQMLGGPGGQTYLGARFPAHPDYSGQIMGEAAKIGRRFAREGIVGRFAVDFIVVRAASGGWEPYAIEVNLRKGGTTAPFLILQYLTDGRYDAEHGLFENARGHPKCYVSSDHVKSNGYRAFTPLDVFDILTRQRLHFDHTSHTGVVLHMLSGVSTLGELGVTAIGNSLSEAEALYQKCIEVLDNAARRFAGQ